MIMQQFEFRAMNCQMLAVLDSDEPRAIEALTDVPAWFAEWENVFSRFRADSELNHLNASDGRAFHASEPLWQVIQESLNAARASDGLVTPAMLDALENAGYDRSFELMDTHPGLDSSHSVRVADWRTIECDADTRTIHLPRGTRLDLGGIAKGWCADQAARRLSAIAPALVDAGGDIAISGALANGDAWQIGIADPFAPDRDLEQLLVRAGGIATSGRDYRRWKIGSQPQHHIIDPRTGRPAETDVLSATVIASSASQAEIAAKVALILGTPAGLEWIDTRPQCAGLLVTEDGRMIASARFEEYVLRETLVSASSLPIWN